MSVSYPDLLGEVSEEDQQQSATSALVLACNTFNNIDQLKLLGFANIKRVIIDERSCNKLLYAFLNEHKYIMKSVPVLEYDPVDLVNKEGVREVFLFYDGHGNSMQLVAYCTRLRQLGVELYFFETAVNDPRCLNRL